MTGIGLAGLTGLGVVSAATNNSTDPQSGIIDKLAAKFNLNRDDVEAVFEEERTERETERHQKVEERLAQAVADGTITEEQKTKILAKLEELRAHMDANRDAMKEKSPEERREAMKQHREELQQWAEDNDIPLRYLMFMRGHGHHGPGMGEMRADYPPES